MAIVRASGKRCPQLDHEICPPEDIAELRHIAKYRPGEYANCLNILRAHRLVRQGFLRRTQHSEQVRGERRFYWWRFELTDKGRAFLTAVADRP